MGDSTDKKTCTGCGFLCAFHRQKHEAVAIDDAMREDWTTSMDRTNGLAFVEDVPRCFVSAMPLAKEYKESQEQTEWAKGLEIITKERQCPRFRAWIPGQSPKEHLEMEIVEQMQRLQDERTEKDRRFQAEQRELADARETARRKDDRERHAAEREKDRQHQKEQATAAFRRQLFVSLVSLLVGALLTLLIAWLTNRT